MKLHVLFSLPGASGTPLTISQVAYALFVSLISFPAKYIVPSCPKAIPKGALSPWSAEV